MLMVLLKLICKNSKFESGGAGPPEIKVGGLGPRGFPGSVTYGSNYCTYQQFK